MDSKGIDAVNYEDTATVPLAYHEMCMTRNAKLMRHTVIAWALSIIIVVGLFVFLWLQYDYVSTTEYTGVYNLVDSEGNVVTSDISPDDVIRIMEELNRGASAQNTEPEA